jgi:DUF4097 and DUF4098 domain-containing protein YvlB
MKTSAIALSLAMLAAPAAVSGQQFPFEQSHPVDSAVTLDLRTERGRIEISGGDESRVVIRGTVTVRNGWNVPANAVALAERVANNPPVERTGAVFSLRPPAGSDERRAVTVSYSVRVPRGTVVTAVSDSGAVTVRAVAGAVTIRTQSAAIEMADLGGAVDVTTGSGAVTADGVRGDLTVETASSAFTGRGLGGALRIETGSGSVNASLTGTGDVQARTQSSEIRIRGARAAVHAQTQSGRVSVSGSPGSEWDIQNQSGSVDLELTSAPGADLDLASRSGSVTVRGASVDGAAQPRSVAGEIGGGGSSVRVRTGSGAARVTVGG